MEDASHSPPEFQLLRSEGAGGGPQPAPPRSRKLLVLKLNAAFMLIVVGVVVAQRELGPDTRTPSARQREAEQRERERRAPPWVSRMHLRLTQERAERDFPAGLEHMTFEQGRLASAEWIADYSVAGALIDRQRAERLIADLDAGELRRDYQALRERVGPGAFVGRLLSRKAPLRASRLDVYRYTYGEGSGLQHLDVFVNHLGEVVRWR